MLTMPIRTPFFFLCLCLTIIVDGSKDASSTNFLTNLLGSFRGPDAINITQFLSTFQMPSCMKQCIPEVGGFLSALSKSNETEDLASICSELQASTQCATSAGCSKIFTDAAASAFQFVCLDNIQAISESMECVKNAASDIQPECEAHCSVQSRIIEDASNNNLTAIFQMPRLCNSTRCLLTCFKNKIDSKCHLGEKNLLDSLLSAVMRGEDHGFEDALDWIMPAGCKVKSSNDTTPLTVGQVPRRNSPISVGSTNKSNSNTVSTNKKAEKVKPFGSNKPMTVRLPPASMAMEHSTKPVEAALILDGQVRTLRYQLLDWQGVPVPTPDFETLAKIMTTQLLPFKFARGRPRETVNIPTEKDEKEAEKRLEEKIASTEMSEEEKTTTMEGPDVVMERTNDGMAVAIGLIVFMATVFYWAWEASRDLP